MAVMSKKFMVVADVICVDDGVRRRGNQVE